jgi:hypothetical protein
VDRPTTFNDTISTCKNHQESLPTVIDIQLLPGIQTAPLSEQSKDADASIRSAIHQHDEPISDRSGSPPSRDASYSLRIPGHQQSYSTSTTWPNSDDAHENGPEAIQKLPSGPLCIFVDGSWKDEGNELENLFLPPHIPRPSQTGRAGIVIMADNPEWPNNICTIHLSNGQTIGTNSYQIELAAIMSALHLNKMVFNQQNSPHITIWTDCEAVYKYDK